MQLVYNFGWICIYSILFGFVKQCCVVFDFNMLNVYVYSVDSCTGIIDLCLDNIFPVRLSELNALIQTFGEDGEMC